MSAKEALLGSLHEAVADDLLRKVQSGEATAQELNAAIKFLKDNEIGVVRNEGDKLSQIAKSLPDFDVDEEGHYAN